MQSDNPSELSCKATVGLECTLDTDIILESKEGKFFGGHKRLLEEYAGFMPSTLDKSSTIQTIKMEEKDKTLRYLLHFMHYSAEQPDVKALYFFELRDVAYAVEKYMVEPARQLCKLAMELQAKEYGVEVFFYAAQHGYNDVLSKAAPHTIDADLYDIEKGVRPEVFLAWVRYREQWQKLQKNVFAHEFCECETNALRDAILRRLGSQLSALRHLDLFIGEHANLIHCQESEERTESYLLDRAELCRTDFSKFMC